MLAQPFFMRKADVYKRQALQGVCDNCTAKSKGRE